MTDAEQQAIRALESLYRDLDRQLPPAAGCKACGKCCHFKTCGHRLYASYLEYLFLISLSGRPERAFDEDQCGYQRGTVCIAREGRTLGCRTFFCSDPLQTAGVHERALGEIKRITTRFGLPWVYRPLGEHFDRAGRAQSSEVQCQ
jgi:hypothetical protein